MYLRKITKRFNRQITTGRLPSLQCPIELGFVFVSFVFELYKRKNLDFLLTSTVQIWAD